MRRRILVVEENAELCRALSDLLTKLGHFISTANDCAAALSRADIDQFSLIIFDMKDSPAQDNQSRVYLFMPVVIKEITGDPPRTLRFFKATRASEVRLPFDAEELSEVIEKSLGENASSSVEDAATEFLERIEFELPSSLGLMDGVLNYLIERVLQTWAVAEDERSGLYIALIEAFVNAVKHGNKNDPSKSVKLITEIAPREARFVVEDEGEGFRVEDVPHPRDTGNLLKASGRGIFLINNIMDEVEYNGRGNRLTMIKRTESSSA